MKADSPFNSADHFFLPKPGAPADSWWTRASRDKFTATCLQELPRMQGSEFGKRGVVLTLAKEQGTGKQIHDRRRRTTR